MKKISVKENLPIHNKPYQNQTVSSIINFINIGTFSMVILSVFLKRNEKLS